ncbi:MAG: metalloregulator ArsR/SmtB family transcription factor [Parvularculaceae bacterium]
MARRDMPLEEMQANAEQACTLLKSMSNETRLLILCQLADGEHSVGELLEKVQLSQSALSQHLAVLRRERLVSTRREAQSILYSLSSDDVRAIIGTLYVLYCEKPTSRARKAFNALIDA